MPSKKKKKHTFKDNALIILICNTAVIITYGIIVIFMVINIVGSQYVPSIFYDLINGKREALVEIFMRAKNVSQFHILLPEVEQTFSKHSKEVYKESSDRKAQIHSLMTILELNSESPEILYSLHLLYQAEKDIERADMYLQRARMFDPQIGL